MFIRDKLDFVIKNCVVLPTKLWLKFADESLAHASYSIE